MYHLLYNIFSHEMDMHYAADYIPQEHIFHAFDWKNKSRAVRKPLPSHQERCLAPRNRYAASLRPETVTILQRGYATLKFDWWHWPTIGHLSQATPSFVHPGWASFQPLSAICELKQTGVTVRKWLNRVLTSMTFAFYLDLLHGHHSC